MDLSYGVEAIADLGMLVPALRVESYHEALIDSTSLDRRAATTGRMLERLANAIDAELTSVQSVEARADDARRVRTVAAVTFVTTIAGMISLLFAFLGINASEVDPARSMFDHRYLAIYRRRDRPVRAGAGEPQIGEVALQGPLRGRPPRLRGQDRRDLCGGPPRRFLLQRDRQFQHRRRGGRGHPARGRDQRGEPAGAVSPAATR